MQPKIYVTAAAMATVDTIAGLSYYDRVCLTDEPDTDVSGDEGYFLNTDALSLAALPQDADVAVRLTLDDIAKYRRHVSIPADLRGVIFSGAPNLPDNYAELIGYWSPLTPTSHHRNAKYFQNVSNSYCVALEEDDVEAADEEDVHDNGVDVLLSDGLVVCIDGLSLLIAGLKADQFIEVQIPIDPTMLGVELDDYRSPRNYEIDSDQKAERIFLRVGDILASPNVGRLAICAVRTELFDYGYTY